MSLFFHVTSSKNRESIKRHGLDWTRMGDIGGIAGSGAPEQEGIFLCLDESEADWFISMNAPGGLLDVWAVQGVQESELVESPEHHFFLPRPIPSSQIALLHADIALRRREWDDEWLDSHDGWTFREDPQRHERPEGS